MNKATKKDQKTILNSLQDKKQIFCKMLLIYIITNIYVVEELPVQDTFLWNPIED